eukprot:6091850-Amphidinium_carterae.1
MSKTLESSGLELFDKLKFDKILTDFADYYGMCERIFKTPIPLAYTRLTARSAAAVFYSLMSFLDA